MKLSSAEIEQLKRDPRNSIVKIVTDWGVALRAERQRSFTHCGPCPFHSPDLKARDSTSFACSAEAWACVTCGAGGDVFDLIAQRERLDVKEDFRKIVDLLTGGAGVKPLSAEEARALEQAAAEKQRLAEAEQNIYRDRQRAGAYDDYYKYGVRLSHPRARPVIDYLNARLGTSLGPREFGPLLLRCNPEGRYYVPDKPRARLIHTGPALLGAITRPDGKFGGVHKTFIDLARPPKCKALIVDPKDQADKDPKMTRGSMRGGHVDLTGVESPRELVLGEGTEKVLAVWCAMRESGRDISQMAFWSAMNLGNLGGKHAELVPHPTLTTPTGRIKKVPGPLPDLATTAITIPDSVERLILLGDSTSDAFATANVLVRARTRYERPGRHVVAAMAPPGVDFDDVLREAMA